MFLNAMLSHGNMPDKPMQSVMIAKNKKGDITNTHVWIIIDLLLSQQFCLKF